MATSKKKKAGNKADQDARSRILERSVDLFYYQGVHATGINQIIREAAVAKDTLYRLFPSKDRLIEESLIIWGRRLVVLWERKLKGAGNPEELFRNWIKLEKDSLRKLPGYNGCPVATIMMELGRNGSEGLRKAASEIENKWQSFLASEFARFQKEGSLDPSADAYLLARQTLTVYQGGLTMWRISDDANYMAEMESSFLKLIRR